MPTTQASRSKRWNVNNPLKGLSCQVGEMRTDGGGSLWWQIDAASSALASQIVEQAAETPAYRLLDQLLSGGKLTVFFRGRVKREILPAIRALYIAQWWSGSGPAGIRHEVVWSDHAGMGPVLQAVWPSTDIHLTLAASQSLYRTGRALAGRWNRRIRRLTRTLRQPLSSGRPSPLTISPGPTISVHYREGIDINRRSDLFWYRANVADPHRILILFDRLRSAQKGRPVPEFVLQHIEAAGMRWVCLEHGQVERSGGPVWDGQPSQESLLAEFRRRNRKPAGALDRWITPAAEWLLEQVDYWLAFYRAFDVRVHVDVAGASNYHMAQGMALDLVDGVRIGWQRSDQTTPEGTEIGHQANQVYFTWNSRALADPLARRDLIGPVLVSGFPYDGAWDSDTEPQALRARLEGRGVGFVVALFDNMILPEGHFSRSMMSDLYQAFLDWVIEEPKVGVITKSKKPSIRQELPEISGLMARAEATGRWINLDDVFGRLPSDASRAADISVGIGISTAANEAVAAEGRAVHCDLTAMHSHPFYKWGYEKVVFDDLARMMEAFKRHLADPATEPGLGDFSLHIEQVDPFMDGRAGERIGSYIGTLIEGFDAGLNRDNAIPQANQRYAKEWGEEHVLEHGCSPSPIRT